MSGHLVNYKSANPRNLKMISSSKDKSPPQQIYPNNKAYLEPSPIQSQVKELNRDRMIEQNKKMKKQVLLLAEQMSKMVAKGHQKKKYGINFDEMLGLHSEVQKQEVRIADLKGEIFGIKKENQYTFNESAVVEKENAVRALEGGVKQLETERNGLLKVRREQEKALHSHKNNDGYNEKIEKSRAQLSKLKEECKVLTLKTAENEKQLLKTHGKTVGKNKRIKEVEERIRENREKLRKGTQHVVTVEMISEIEQEIMKLETEFKELQKSWQEKINNVEVEFNNRRIEEQKKLIVLKDKERESKLNEIRLKEFRKLIIQSRSEPKEQEGSMREFRSKRNIKYIEKEAV